MFGSWQSDRAKVYRRLNDIPGGWGTAVNVQAMVFGNMGDTSATGVAFTRDPAKGEHAYYGEFLINAQGEDVVAGIRTPQYLTKAAREEAGAKPASMEEAMPEVYGELAKRLRPLETHYRDMQDIEFTVAGGQALDAPDARRQAHRQGRAQDRGRHGERGADHARRRRSGADRSARARPAAPPDARSQGARATCIAKGLPASPGAASGIVGVRRRHRRDRARRARRGR